MEKITITIDHRPVQVEPGTTVLAAARTIGIKIPTLCHMHLHDLDYDNKPGACRICVVEIDGRRNLAPSCKTECTDGMVVRTHSPRVLAARQSVMELILSNHPNECLECTKNGYCDLQSVASDLRIRKIRYHGARTEFKKDVSCSIVRNMSKCILCRRCETACNVIQSVGALSAVDRGFESVVSTAFDRHISHTNCINCGQCVAICPTGALTERSHIADVLKAVADPSKVVIVQTAPSVRVGLGKDFGYSGQVVTGKMVTALRQLGFDYVFDTDFTADLTIMEEGTELLQRLHAHLNGDKNIEFPLMTSCCPGWVGFVEKHYPELLPHLSTAKSPQQMFGAVAKNYFASQMGIRREDMVVVAVMPCVAKKYECMRPEFQQDGNPDVDISITVRELARLIRYANIDFTQLEDGEFDAPLGESTGAGVIFGATGGVIEAAVRTAYEVQTGKALPRIDFTELRGLAGIRSATIDFDGIPIHIGIAHGLANARKLVEEIRTRTSPYHAVEVMACPGGCIGGGGQPYHRGDIRVLLERQASLYAEDAGKPLRKSHENPYIKQLYNNFLDKPCSHTSHQYLHTSYTNRKSEFKSTLCGEKTEQIRRICREFRNDPGELINVLHRVQETFGYLPLEVQECVAGELNIPAAEVYGVVTFYSFFTMKPKGKYPISICLGTACYVRGAEKILDEFKRKLGIGVGETTEDGLFSLDSLRCIGACGLAPVVMVGSKVYGRLSSDKVADIIDEYYQKEAVGPVAPSNHSM